MRGVTTRGDGAVELRDDLPKPELLDSADAILRVTAAAICGSDLHFIKTPAIAPSGPLGHEFIGIVESIGDGVRGLAIGDRVMSNMFVACGLCPECRRGHQTRCPEYKLFGSEPLAGGQAEFVRIPHADLVLTRLDDAVSEEDALVLTDILPTAWAAVENPGVGAGSSLAIVGAGPVGQLIAELALARGASSVFSVDFNEQRLSRAEALGAIPIRGGENAARAIIDANDGRGVDVAIDAVGSVNAAATAFESLRVGGCLGLVGIITEGLLPLEAIKVLAKQAVVMQIVGNPYTDNEVLIAMIRARRLSPGRVIERSYPLADALEAYRAFESREVVKAILRP
jgi:alcohol dehydrogenase